MTYANLRGGRKLTARASGWRVSCPRAKEPSAERAKDSVIALRAYLSQASGQFLGAGQIAAAGGVFVNGSGQLIGSGRISPHFPVRIKV
jgi:hypothetical protein